MLRSMYAGISGLKNFQVKLDVIGNNISNVNTSGFKKGRVMFKDLISQQIAGAASASPALGGQNPKQVGLGGSVASIDTVQTPGSPQSTGRDLDLAINGDGFLIGAKGNAQYFTRAGNLFLDTNGTLVTAEGLKVQGYQVVAGVKQSTLGDIIISENSEMPPKKTANITLAGNLPSDAPLGTKTTKKITFYDDKGNKKDIDVIFVNTAANTWDVYSDAYTGVAATDAPFHMGQLVTTGTPPVFTEDAAWQGIDFDDDGTFDLTNTDIDYEETAVTNDPGVINFTVATDGCTHGKLESYSFGQTGEVSAVYSNGQVVTIGVLAMATFANAGGLTKVGNNTYLASINSGAPEFGTPGDGRGVIIGGALEMSNVDLSEEFTEMIVAQRGFQANTRIITTSDEVLQELVNLKR